MRRGIFLQTIGDLGTESVLQSLTSIDGQIVSANDLRLAFPRGFTVAVQIEQRIAETDSERRELADDFHRRLAAARTPDEKIGAMVPPDRKLLALLLIPRNS